MRSDTPPFDPTALTRHARLLAQMLRTVALPDAPVPCMDGVVYAADWLDQLQDIPPIPEEPTCCNGRCTSAAQRERNAWTLDIAAMLRARGEHSAADWLAPSGANPVALSPNKPPPDLTAPNRHARGDWPGKDCGQPGDLDGAPVCWAEPAHKAIWCGGPECRRPGA